MYTDGRKFYNPSDNLLQESQDEQHRLYEYRFEKGKEESRTDPSRLDNQKFIALSSRGDGVFIEYEWPGVNLGKVVVLRLYDNIWSLRVDGVYIRKWQGLPFTSGKLTLWIAELLTSYACTVQGVDNPYKIPGIRSITLLYVDNQESDGVRVRWSGFSHRFIGEPYSISDHYQGNSVHVVTEFIDGCSKISDFDPILAAGGADPLRFSLELGMLSDGMELSWFSLHITRSEEGSVRYQLSERNSGIYLERPKGKEFKTLDGLLRAFYRHVRGLNVSLVAGAGPAHVALARCQARVSNTDILRCRVSLTS